MRCPFHAAWSSPIGLYDVVCPPVIMVGWENIIFIDNFPNKPAIYRGCSFAIFDYQGVTWQWNVTHSWMRNLPRFRFTTWDFRVEIVKLRYFPFSDRPIHIIYLIYIFHHIPWSHEIFSWRPPDIPISSHQFFFRGSPPKSCHAPPPARGWIWWIWDQIRSFTSPRVTQNRIVNHPKTPKKDEMVPKLSHCRPST